MRERMTAAAFTTNARLAIIDAYATRCRLLTSMKARRSAAVIIHDAVSDAIFDASATPSRPFTGARALRPSTNAAVRIIVLGCDVRP
eukprot:4744235-Prymnesium_polylepis.1